MQPHSRQDPRKLLNNSQQEDSKSPPSNNSIVAIQTQNTFDLSNRKASFQPQMASLRIHADDNNSMSNGGMDLNDSTNGSDNVKLTKYLSTIQQHMSSVKDSCTI